MGGLWSARARRAPALLQAVTLASSSASSPAPPSQERCSRKEPGRIGPSRRSAVRPPPRRSTVRRMLRRTTRRPHRKGADLERRPASRPAETKAWGAALPSAAASSCPWPSRRTLRACSLRPETAPHGYGTSRPASACAHLRATTRWCAPSWGVRGDHATDRAALGSFQIFRPGLRPPGLGQGLSNTKGRTGLPGRGQAFGIRNDACAKLARRGDHGCAV